MLVNTRGRYGAAPTAGSRRGRGANDEVPADTGGAVSTDAPVAAPRKPIRVNKPPPTQTTPAGGKVSPPPPPPPPPAPAPSGFVDTGGTVNIDLSQSKTTPYVPPPTGTTAPEAKVVTYVAGGGVPRYEPVSVDQRAAQAQANADSDLQGARTAALAAAKTAKNGRDNVVRLATRSSTPDEKALTGAIGAVVDSTADACTAAGLARRAFDAAVKGPPTHANASKWDGWLKDALDACEEARGYAREAQAVVNVIGSGGGGGGPTGGGPTPALDTTEGELPLSIGGGLFGWLADLPAPVKIVGGVAILGLGAWTLLKKPAG